MEAWIPFLLWDKYLPILATVGAMTLTFTLFRLSAFNNFVDVRKTTIRHVFRELCEAFPDLLVLVQNIGKSRPPKRGNRVVPDAWRTWQCPAILCVGALGMGRGD